MKRLLLLNIAAGPSGLPRVSLFPFLAVLICTMGALVLLLLTVTRQARLQAVREAAQKISQQQVVVQAEQEKLLSRVAGLQGLRKQKQAVLSRARSESNDLQAQTTSLQEQLGQADVVCQNLDKARQGLQQRHAESDERLAAVQAKIASTSRQLSAAREIASKQAASYAILPYEGPNSTHRRPIYLECRADAVVLQPEGIVFSASDFEGPLKAGNPLDAAVRAACKYLIAEIGSSRPQEGEPYPLLLVRPSGIPAYYAARDALGSFNAEFGYELVDEQWQLRFPPPDPKLAQAVRLALVPARQRQQEVIAAEPPRAARSDKVVYRASPRGGVRRDSGSSDDDEQTGPVFGKLADGSAARPQAGFDPPAGSNAAAPGMDGPGSGSSGVEPGTDGLNFLAGRPGIPGPASPSRAGGSDAAKLASGGSLTDAGTQGTAVSGPGGYPSGPSAEPGPRLGSATGAFVSNGSAGPAPMTGSDGIGPGAGGTQGGTLRGVQAFLPAAGSTAGSASVSDSLRVMDSPVHSEASRSSGLGIQSTEGSVNPTPATVTRPEGYVAGRPADPSLGSHASLRSASGEGEPQLPLRPGEWRETERQPPRPEKRSDDKDQDKKDVKRLADVRGTDWALRNRARASMPISRPINVECGPDRLVVAGERSRNERETVIGLSSSGPIPIDTFISAIWRRMNEWGIAGNGMYWRPILSVHVLPGGESRFNELRKLLDGSGMTVRKAA